MTRDLQKRFEECWPGIASRLAYLLVRYRVPAAKRDDVIQETATRLVSMWENVDRSRDVWPLAKTIALNLLRDEARKVYEEIPTEIEGDHPSDLDRLFMARLEWSRVVTALAELSPQHRAALLCEVGEGERSGTSAEKMLRMRARRSLKEALKRLPALLPARLRSLEWGTLFGPVSQTAVPGLACVACLSLLPSGALVPDTQRAAIVPAEVRIVEAAPVGDGNTPFSLSPDLMASRERGGGTTVAPGHRVPAEKGSYNPGSQASEPASPLPPAPELPTNAPVDEPSAEVVVSPEVPDAPEAPDAPKVPLPNAASGVEAITEELLDL